MTKAPKAAPASAGAPSNASLSTDDLALAAQHVELLREIHAGDHATKTDLAKHLGRDLSNLNKTLKILADAGLAHAEGIGGGLPVKGQRALKAIDQAAGAASDEPGLSVGPASGVVGLLHRQIIPDPKQARKDWDSEEAKRDLAELADDVVDKGVLQNLLVRDPDAVLAFLPDDPAALAIEEGLTLYMLDGGERRWRAVGLAIADGRWPADRLIDCRIIESDALGHKLVGLAENLQRRSLNPIEKAEAFEDLAITGGLSNAEIAAKVKSTPEHVQQHRRFLKLTKADQARMVLPRDDERHLSVRGARTLLADIAAREAEVEKLKSIPPEERLAIAELVHALLARGRHYWAEIPIPAEAHSSAIGKALAERDWARFSDAPRSYGQDTLGHFTVQRGYSVPHPLVPWANSNDAKVRDEGLKAAQIDAGYPDATDYVTPWLSATVERSPEGLAMVEEAAARTLKIEEENKLRDETAKRIRIARAAARASASQLVDAIRADTPAASTPGLEPVCVEFDHPLPWAVNDRAELVDAQGKKILRVGEQWGPVTDREHGLALILAMAVNVAAGAAVPATPEVPQRAPFEAHMVKRLAELRPALTPEEAAAQATAMLDQFLDENGASFGEEGWDWGQEGAEELVVDFLDADNGETSEDDAEAAAPESEAA